MKKTIKIVLLVAFGSYCFALFKVLFIDGRFQTEDSIGFFFSRSNLVPFRSVFDYFQKLAENRIELDTVLRNIIGNLIVLFPMGCFLPCLFEKFQSYKATFLLCLGIIAFVEILQPLLRIGFFDIDDFIFNLIGASLGFLIVHIPPINKLLKKIFLYA